jgi:hypothetical protein
MNKSIESDATKTQRQGDDRGDRRTPRRDHRDRREPPHDDEPELDRKPDQTDPPVPGRTPVQIRGALAPNESSRSRQGRKHEDR